MEATFLSPPPALAAKSSALVARAASLADAGTDIKASARKAANEFESVFLNTYLEGMFAGLKTDGPFGGGQGEKMYRSLLLGEYSKSITASGGLGIADEVYREILAIQERSQK